MQVLKLSVTTRCPLGASLAEVGCDICSAQQLDGLSFEVRKLSTLRSKKPRSVLKVVTYDTAGEIFVLFSDPLPIILNIYLYEQHERTKNRVPNFTGLPFMYECADVRPLHLMVFSSRQRTSRDAAMHAQLRRIWSRRYRLCHYGSVHATLWS